MLPSVASDRLLHIMLLWTRRKAEQNELHGTEMRQLRWLVGIQIRNEETRARAGVVEIIARAGVAEIRARAGVAEISENISEARLRWLGHVEKKTEQDVIMRTWKTEMVGTCGEKDRARCSNENMED